MAADSGHAAIRILFSGLEEELYVDGMEAAETLSSFLCVCLLDSHPLFCLLEKYLAGLLRRMSLLCVSPPSYPSLPSMAGIYLYRNTFMEHFLSSLPCTPYIR